MHRRNARQERKIMLNRNSPTPLHQQLEEIIKAKIENDEWQPDAQIPSENELSKTYGLSRMTTRNVIMRLVFQGLLYRVAGKGTFVAEPKITNKLLLQMGIQEQLDQMGIESETRLIEIRKIEAPVRIQRELALPEGSQVFNIERLRLVKGDPLSIHISYVPVELAGTLDTESGFEELQLCDILEEKFHLRTSRVVETLETSLATDREAERLAVKPGFTLLRLENTEYTAADVPFVHNRVTFRGDKIKIKLEFNRKG